LGPVVGFPSAPGRRLVVEALADGQGDSVAVGIVLRLHLLEHGIADNVARIRPSGLVEAV
jgi:hypothetical protein